ncbi:hypothetical protein DPX16_21427 [Anabarilius grahami]|uniref:Uncharacterized protein n=1 Tax=Anabarilius grahami TaxID=495550 RepID=A0A3N0XWE3_ANAGA|nr:hypothetical protein DPX16_21427 [Anabarilius grahami]
MKVKQKPGDEKSGLDGDPVAETSKDIELGASNLNYVDNEKPRCSSVNGIDVVKDQLRANDVGLHVSGVECASKEENDEVTDIMCQNYMNDDGSL